jgi:hypothetical protein
MLRKLSVWSCLEIRMQDEFTVQTDNSSFEMVEQFRYFGKTITNRHSIYEEIKRRFK